MTTSYMLLNMGQLMLYAICSGTASEILCASRYHYSEFHSVSKWNELLGEVKSRTEHVFLKRRW